MKYRRRSHGSDRRRVGGPAGRPVTYWACGAGVASAGCLAPRIRAVVGLSGVTEGASSHGAVADPVANAYVVPPSWSLPDGKATQLGQCAELSGT